VRTPAEAGGLVGPHLQAFFAEHLLAHKRASPQTIACYRDPFRLLLRFMRERTGAEPAALPLAALDADAVLAFLDYIERDRNCTVRSRNNRLAAIRSFFRLVALHVPDSLGQVTRVMAIPTQRGDKRRVNYLTRDEVKALLAAPDRTAWSGRRDHALLLTLYNSGARLRDHHPTARAADARQGPRPAPSMGSAPPGSNRASRTADDWDKTAAGAYGFGPPLTSRGRKAHHPAASGAFGYLPIPTGTSCLLSHHQTATALVVSADIGAATASTFRRGIRNATTALVRAPIRICDTPIAADAMPA